MPRQLRNMGGITNAVPREKYDQAVFFSLVRDLNGLIEKLNTTFQEEKTEDNDSIIFFLGS